MGRRVISEVVLMQPKTLRLAIAQALGQPYFAPFLIQRTRVEVNGKPRTPPKVWKQHWTVRKDGVTTHGHA
jgi:hypothetical protein